MTFRKILPKGQVAFSAGGAESEPGQGFGQGGAEDLGHTHHRPQGGGEQRTAVGAGGVDDGGDRKIAGGRQRLGQGLPGEQRPEKGLLRLRAGMGVYSNNRPAKIWPQLSDASPLKKSIVEKGIDFIIVRELIGGIYFGEHKTDDADGQPVATDIMKYSEAEIERIGRIGFETARKRNHRLCSVEKSNVLDTSRLWKKVMHRLAEEYTDVELTDMLVDNCAMQIVKNPAQFDVIVTENMFGDILSDEASMITGSIGMIPSSSLGATSCGLYEPIHGSAPDIAGQDLANPIGTILSAAMMLRYSFDMAKEADAVEHAVSKYLDAGYRTADIMEDGMTKVGCKKCGDLILEYLTKE